jgi:hypothetical protein
MAMPEKALLSSQPNDGTGKFSTGKKMKFKNFRDLSPSRRFRRSSPDPGSDRDYRERSVDSDKPEKPSRRSYLYKERTPPLGCESDSNGNKLLSEIGLYSNSQDSNLFKKSAFTHKKTSKFVPPLKPLTIPVLTVDDATSGSDKERSPGYLSKEPGVRRASVEAPGSPRPGSGIKKSHSDSHLDLVWGPLMTRMHHGKWVSLVSLYNILFQNKYD